MATVLSASGIFLNVLAHVNERLLVALGSFVGTGEWSGSWCLTERFLVPNASILLAGCLGSWVLAKRNLVGVLDISGGVGADIEGNSWGNGGWLNPHATVLLAGLLSSWVSAESNLGSVLDISGGVSAGSWSLTWINCSW